MAVNEVKYEIQNPRKLEERGNGGSGVKLQPGAVERGRAGHARGRGEASSDKVNNWPQEWMVVGKWAKPLPE